MSQKSFFSIHANSQGSLASTLAVVFEFESINANSPNTSPYFKVLTSIASNNKISGYGLGLLCNEFEGDLTG